MDSTAIIDFSDGNESLKKLLDGLKESLAVNYISYLEVIFGLNLVDENYKFEENFYDGLFESFSNLNLDIAACKEASRIRWDLKRKGQDIGAFDCAIAGIYLTNGINKIITRNVKHFGRIKGMKAIGY